MLGASRISPGARDCLVELAREVGLEGLRSKRVGQRDQRRDVPTGGPSSQLRRTGANPGEHETADRSRQVANNRDPRSWAGARLPPELGDILTVARVLILGIATRSRRSHDPPHEPSEYHSRYRVTRAVLYRNWRNASLDVVEMMLGVVRCVFE